MPFKMVYVRETRIILGVDSVLGYDSPLSALRQCVRRVLVALEAFYTSLHPIMVSL